MNNKTILLVEDDEDQVVLAMRALRKHGIVAEVDEVVAGDGEEALDYLFAKGAYAGRDPDLVPEFVLLDLKLPKVDGLEALERMREDERTRLVPVIVVSSSGEDDDVVAGYELGANSYVAEPANFERFSEAMRYLGWCWLNYNETS